MKPVLLYPGDNRRLPAEPVEFRHYIKTQVRFSDVDMLGHINNSIYLNFFDMGKTRYFEAAVGRIDFRHIPLVVVNLNCDLMEPCYFDDDLMMYTRVDRIGHRSITMEQRIVDNKTGHTRSRCMTVMAGFNPDEAHGAALDPRYIEAIEAFEGRPLRAESN